MSLFDYECDRECVKFCSIESCNPCTHQLMQCALRDHTWTGWSQCLCCEHHVGIKVDNREEDEIEFAV